MVRPRAGVPVLRPAAAFRSRTIVAVEGSDSASVRRLLDVLDALAEPPVVDSHGVPRAQLGVRVGRERTAVAPTVEALVAAGLVDRDAEGDRVRAGWGLYLLAARVVGARARAVAPRYVDELVERTGESAYALRLHGLHSVTEAERSGPSDLHVASWLGRPFPVYGSDAGPALLLDLERDELEARFHDVRFEAFAPNTPRSPAELYERVERARARGWALLDEEGEPGIASAAAPVRTFTGEIALALAVAGPRFRLLERIEEAGSVVSEVAGRMSAELGYRAYAAASAAAASPQQCGGLVDRRRQPARGRGDLERCDDRAALVADRDREAGEARLRLVVDPHVAQAAGPFEVGLQGARPGAAEGLGERRRAVVEEECPAGRRGGRRGHASDAARRLQRGVRRHGRDDARLGAVPHDELRALPGAAGERRQDGPSGA